MCNKNISEIVQHCYWKNSQILSYHRFYGNMYSHAILTNCRHHIVNLTITVYVCSDRIFYCFMFSRRKNNIVDYIRRICADCTYPV